jgi:DNA primase
VNYDGDRAGVQAAKRAIETLLAEDLEVKVLVLPDNADPDDFIRKYGVLEYQQRRGEAQPHIQFVIDQAVRDRDLRRPAEKAAAIEETLLYVRAVRNRIQRREYFDIAMDSLRVQPDQRREIWQRVRTGASGDGPSVQEIVRRGTTARPTVAEEKLLHLLLADDELRRIIVPRLKLEDYEELSTAALFKALVKLHESGDQLEPGFLNDASSEDPVASETLARLLITEPAESGEDSLAAAESCLHALRLLKVNRRIDELSAEIAQADRAGEAEKRDGLAIEVLELTKKRNALLPQMTGS